jgi:hypothetical protein
MSEVNDALVDSSSVLQHTLTRLAEAIRESKRLSGIPVLVVNSSDSPGDRGAAAALGAGYFRKSTSYEEFLELGTVLKKLLEVNGLL